MYCNRCGQKNPPDAALCSRCNAPMRAQRPSAPYGNFYRPNQNPYVYGPRFQGPYRNPAKNWAGITGMVLGIVSVILCMSMANLLLAPLAVIFSAIGMDSEKRSFAIAGLVLGLLAIAWFFMLFLQGWSMLRHF